MRYSSGVSKLHASDSLLYRSLVVSTAYTPKRDTGLFSKSGSHVVLTHT